VDWLTHWTDDSTLATGGRSMPLEKTFRRSIPTTCLDSLFLIYSTGSSLVETLSLPVLAREGYRTVGVPKRETREAARGWSVI
jgi:hypothetical protein